MSKLEQLRALPRRGSVQSVTAPTQKPVAAKPAPAPMAPVLPTSTICPDCLKRREAKRVAQAKWRKKAKEGG